LGISFFPRSTILGRLQQEIQTIGYSTVEQPIGNNIHHPIIVRE